MPANAKRNTLDTGVRKFESGGFETSVKPRDTWITIYGRGGHLMMSVKEADDVITVLHCAQDYLRDSA